MRFRALLAAALGLALVNAHAATFTVTTLDDSGPGSLRQAILDANASAGADTITFTTNGTITLASPLPPIATNLTISGPGTNQLTISGNNAVQVLYVNARVTVTISDLAIANALATGYPAWKKDVIAGFAESGWLGDVLTLLLSLFRTFHSIFS